MVPFGGTTCAVRVSMNTAAIQIAKLTVGSNIIVDGISYEVIESSDPLPNMARVNPAITATLGLKRPKGKKVWYAYQFGATVKVVCAV